MVNLACAAETSHQTIQRQIQEQVQSQDLFQIKLLLAVLEAAVFLIKNPVDLAAMVVQLEVRVAELVIAGRYDVVRAAAARTFTAESACKESRGLAGRRAMAVALS